MLYSKKPILGIKEVKIKNCKSDNQIIWLVDLHMIRTDRNSAISLQSTVILHYFAIQFGSPSPLFFDFSIFFSFASGGLKKLSENQILSQDFNTGW